MADQWNDNIPALTNTIAADIPDIEENFGWIQQLLKMCIGYKTSTIATVGPPGEQRAKFINSTADTHITAEPARYFHDGTTRQLVWWDADLVFECGSGGTNGDSEDLGASEWHYLYLDDTAIITKAGPELDNTCLVNNTTAPTWSDVKHGWYNGADRCIFAFYSDGDSDILEFLHDGGNYVHYADRFPTGSPTTITEAWADATIQIPGFCTTAEVIFSITYVATAGANTSWRTNGQTGGTGHFIGQVSVANDIAVVQMKVITDSSQKIELKSNATAADTNTINAAGWYFPIGM